VEIVIKERNIIIIIIIIIIPDDLLERTGQT
jgi:hypothetical protein